MNKMAITSFDCDSEIKQILSENLDSLEELEEPEEIDKDVKESIEEELRDKSFCNYLVVRMGPPLAPEIPYCRKKDGYCREKFPDCELYQELEGSKQFYQDLKEKYV